jgi:hypothetical protein
MLSSIALTTRREQIDELSGNLQLQTTPLVGNVFCGLIGIAIRGFLFFQVQYGNKRFLKKSSAIVVCGGTHSLKSATGGYAMKS